MKNKIKIIILLISLLTSKINGETIRVSEWATKKGENGLKQYWDEKNQLSIDGIPTHIVAKNG